MLARVDGRALALLLGVWPVAVAGGGGRDERDPDLYQTCRLLKFSPSSETDKLTF